MPCYALSGNQKFQRKHVVLYSVSFNFGGKHNNNCFIYKVSVDYENNGQYWHNKNHQSFYNS